MGLTWDEAPVTRDRNPSSSLPQIPQNLPCSVTLQPGPEDTGKVREGQLSQDVSRTGLCRSTDTAELEGEVQGLLRTGKCPRGHGVVTAPGTCAWVWGLLHALP